MTKTASGFSTRALWAGEESLYSHGATQSPIVQSIAFGYGSMAAWQEVALGRRPGYIYSRNTNPTVKIFEDKVRQLEGGEAAISFASGMAAISNTLLSLVQPGQRVVTITDTYGGTNQLFTEFLPRAGIEVQLCNTDDAKALCAAVTEPCRVLYLETPTNPTLKIIDLAKVISLARTKGTLVVVDNTIATPINQSPLSLGADVVLHSASKFLGGHGDALGGVICGTQPLIDEVFHYREIHGACLDPFAAYLLIRGMKTLGLRVERHNFNALAVARFLEQHPAVDRVFYPGLESHPAHSVAAKQMRGFGGMLSFCLRSTGAPTVSQFLDRLLFAHRAASLGHVETFAGIPATTSHVECSEAQREAMGIPETLIRYSVGIEDIEDLLADLEQALSI